MQPSTHGGETPPARASSLLHEIGRLFATQLLGGLYPGSLSGLRVSSGGVRLINAGPYHSVFPRRRQSKSKIGGEAASSALCCSACAQACWRRLFLWELSIGPHKGENPVRVAQLPCVSTAAHSRRTAQPADERSTAAETALSGRWKVFGTGLNSPGKLVLPAMRRRERGRRDK